MPATGYTRRYSANIPAQATAGTGQAAIVAEMKVAGSLSEAAIQPSAAVTFNGTNYRIFTLFNRGLTGVGTVVMATYDTSVVGLVDNDETLMVLSATPANLLVVAGDILEIVETIAGTGVAHGGYRVEAAVAASAP